jgi:hypothetical protein
MAFLDAAGTCLILVKRDPPIKPVLMGVYITPSSSHTRSTQRRSITCAHGVEITFEEDRQGGVLNGPRANFHDPDGTVLEFIDLTSYAGSRS